MSIQDFAIISTSIYNMNIEILNFCFFNVVLVSYRDLNLQNAYKIQDSFVIQLLVSTSK